MICRKCCLGFGVLVCLQKEADSLSWDSAWGGQNIIVINTCVFHLSSEKSMLSSVSKGVFKLLVSKWIMRPHTLTGPRRFLHFRLRGPLLCVRDQRRLLPVWYSKQRSRRFPSFFSRSNALLAKNALTIIIAWCGWHLTNMWIRVPWRMCLSGLIIFPLCPLGWIPFHHEF